VPVFIHVLCPYRPVCYSLCRYVVIILCTVHSRLKVRKIRQVRGCQLFPDIQPHSDLLLLLLFMSMGWDYISELRPLTGLLFIPQMTKKTCRIMVEWYQQWKTSDSSTRAVWQSYKQSSSSKVGGTDGGNESVLRKSLCSYFELKAMALLSLRRKTCCGFVSPSAGLSPRTLSPIASTITITPPRST
jgi:hypothetical protein